MKLNAKRIGALVAITAAAMGGGLTTAKPAHAVTSCYYLLEIAPPCVNGWMGQNAIYMKDNKAAGRTHDAYTGFYRIIQLGWHRQGSNSYNGFVASSAAWDNPFPGTLSAPSVAELGMADGSNANGEGRASYQY